MLSSDLMKDYIKILILWTVHSESHRSISCGILLLFPTVTPGITADRAMQVPSPGNGILFMRVLDPGSVGFRCTDHHARLQRLDYMDR